MLPKNYLAAPPRDPRAGFTLVELAVVLIIIAVIAGSALTIGVNRNEAAKQRETFAKMERIEEALKAFLILNGRLPCPADPNLGMSNPNLGQELRDAGPPSECAASLQPSGSAVITVGTVPFATLGLPEEFMLDGWARRFTYVVDDNFAMNRNTFSAIAGGIIQVDDLAGNERTPACGADPCKAIMILMSHGLDGSGAWLRSGTRLPDAMDATESENAHDPSAFDFDEVFIQGSRTAAFDDILNYKLKDQLVREAGGVINTESCELAARTLQEINYNVEPQEGPVGCDENSDNVYDQECIMRQTELAQKIEELCSVQNPDKK